MAKGKSFWDKEITRRTFMAASGVTVGGALLFGRSGIGGWAADADDESSPKERLTEVPSVCYMCGNTCAMKVMVDEDGRAVRVEPNKQNPGSAGTLCARAHASIQQLYDPDRLKSPMRKIADDKWEEISWEEAFDTIHENLSSISERYGPETVAFLRRRSSYAYAYNGFRVNFGSPNDESAPSICDSAKRVANNFSFGSNAEMSDFRHAKYIMLFGASQMEAPRYRLRHAKDILDAKRDGAQLIVVDPRYSLTAAKADAYVHIRPGTDALLILSMARVIVDEDLYDHAFVETYGSGFSEFVAELGKDMYLPEQAAEETGIPAHHIRGLAHQFAANKPAIADASSGIHKWSNGTLNHWALNCLNALVGSIDVPGGKVYTSGGRVSWPRIAGSSITAQRHYTEGGWSFGPDIPMHNRALLFQGMLNPETYPAGPKRAESHLPLYGGHGFKGLVVYNTDCIVADADANKVKEALQGLEFAVGIDLYLSSTIYAFPVGSIALPETTFLERPNAFTPRTFVPYVALSLPAVEPLWGAKDSHWIFTKLGKRFGYAGFDAVDEDGLYDVVKEAVVSAEQAGGVHIDWEQICRDGVWVSDQDVRYRRYDRLPNGAFRFALTENLNERGQAFVDASGHDVPRYVSPKPKTEDFSLRFLAGGKVLWLTQGNNRNLPYLMQVFDELHTVQDENFLVMHPSDAAERGVAHKDDIIVKSGSGEITAKAFVSERVQPGFTFMTHGFGHESPHMKFAYQRGSNPAYLIDGMRFDVSGNFTANEETIQVEKA